MAYSIVYNNDDIINSSLPSDYIAIYQGSRPILTYPLTTHSTITHTTHSTVTRTTNTDTTHSTGSRVTSNFATNTASTKSTRERSTYTTNTASTSPTTDNPYDYYGNNNDQNYYDNYYYYYYQNNNDQIETQDTTSDYIIDTTSDYSLDTTKQISIDMLTSPEQIKGTIVSLSNVLVVTVNSQRIDLIIRNGRSFDPEEIFNNTKTTVSMNS